MDRITGAYPGGPTRGVKRGGEDSSQAARTIRGGEDHARSARLREHEHRIRRRRIRVVIGVGATLLISAAAGVFLGLSTTRHAEKALLQEAQSVNSPDDVISRELDRLIDELWRMEELERVPRR